MRIIILTIAALCLVAAIVVATMPRADAQGEGIMSFLPVVQTEGELSASAKSADAPPSDILPTAPRPGGLAQAAEFAKEQAPMEGEIVFASGLETAGGTFTLDDGRTVALPETMFVKHNIVEVLCDLDAWCATAPFVILGEVKAPDAVGIGIQLADGVVFASSAEQAENYTEVLVQLEVDSIVVGGTPVPLAEVTQ